MRTTRIATRAAALAVALIAAGCGGKEATGPNLALSLTDLATLSQELESAMAITMYVPHAPPARSSLLRLARILRAARPFNNAWNCPLNGTASVAGTWDTTATSATGDVTVTYTNCKTAHYTTSGSVHGNGTEAYNPTTQVYTDQATVSGSLTLTHVDGRSGLCPVNVTENGTSSSAGSTHVVSGSACGFNLSGTYH